MAVPQVYVRDEFSSTLKPRRQLAAFTRVELAPGETKEFTLTVGPRALRTLGADYVWRVETGAFTVELGEDAAHILSAAPLTVREA